MAFIRPWGFELTSIRAPVHVWQGRHDRMVPFAHGQWLASHIPTAIPHLFDDEGHLSLARHPVWRHPGCAGRLRALRASRRRTIPSRALVVAALDSLPEVFRERLGSVAIVVEEEASADQLQSVRAHGLFGLYQGVPRTSWAADHSPYPEQDHDLPGTAAARLARRGRPRQAGHRDRPSRDRPPLRDLGRAASRASPRRPLKTVSPRTVYAPRARPRRNPANDLPGRFHAGRMRASVGLHERADIDPS